MRPGYRDATHSHLPGIGNPENPIPYPAAGNSYV